MTPTRKVSLTAYILKVVFISIFTVALSVAIVKGNDQKDNVKITQEFKTPLTESEFKSMILGYKDHMKKTDLKLVPKEINPIIIPTEDVEFKILKIPLLPKTTEKKK